MEIIDRIFEGVLIIIIILCATEIICVMIKGAFGKYNSYKQLRFLLHQSDGDPISINLKLKKETKNEMDKEKET